jgi:hypothetical protein
MPESPRSLDKTVLLDLLRAQLHEQLESLTRSQKTSQAGATHAETRAEDPKDMRSTEASYLARGLATRVSSLREAVAMLAGFAPGSSPADERICAGALLGVEDEEGEISVHLFVPAGGGVRLELDGTVLHSLTAGSPLGRELLGRRAGDDFEIELPGGRQNCLVAWVG